jgi:DHA2 family multidrug resistance protein
VTLSRETVRDRIDQLTSYFTTQGITDPAAAHNQAIVALGKLVRRQSLIMGFSDTFAVLGVLVLAAAVVVVLTKKSEVGGVVAH